MTARFIKCGFLMAMVVWLICSVTVVEGANPDPALPKVIRMGSSPAGLLGYVWATATAKVVSSRTPMGVKVEPYTGTSGFRDLINSGELQLGYNSAPDLYEAYRGLGRFTPASGIRMILCGPSLMGGVLARADSGMKDVIDVKGKRFAGEFKAQYANYLFSYGALASAGLTAEDVQIVPVTNAQAAVTALREGRVDVATHALGAGDVTEANAAIRGGIRWLSLDASPEGVARMKKIVRGGEVGKATSGTGILAPTNLVAWRMVLLTNKNLGEEVVYQIAKAIWENVEDLHPFDTTMTVMTRNTLVAPELAVIPYHPGAVKLYKEKGAWTSKEDAIQTILLKEGGQ